MDTSKNTFLTTNQAGEILGYTRQHVGYLTRRGDLIGFRTGRDILIEQKSVQKYLTKYNGTHRKPGRKPAQNNRHLRNAKKSGATKVTRVDNELVTVSA